MIQLLGLFLQLEPTTRDSAVASRRSLRHTAECTKLENLCLHFCNLNLSEDSNIFCPVSPITPDHVQLPTDILWVLPVITPPDISADQISIMLDHLDLTAPDFPGGFIHSTPRRPKTPPSPLTPITSSNSSSLTPSFSRLFDASESIPRLSVPSATLPRPLTQLQTTHQPISNPPTLPPARSRTIPTASHPQPIPVPPVTNPALPPQLLHYLKDIDFLSTLTALDDCGKIRAAIRYADLEEAEVWQTLPEAAPVADNWDAFIVAVKGLYPGCEGDDCYCRTDLQYLIEEYQSKPMRNQDDLGEYQQKFTKISALLIKTKKLAETEWDSMFLNGFLRAIADRIHHQLSIVCTDLHPDDPYPLAEVVKAAKFLLTGSTLHSAVPTMGTAASPAALPSSAYMPQRPPASTVVKQEYSFQTQPLPQQHSNTDPAVVSVQTPTTGQGCARSLKFISAPVRSREVQTTVSIWQMGAESHVSLNASARAVTPAALHNVAVQGTANLFCVAHPEVDVLEIQPSAFLNTIQDADEPVADLADPDFQAYVTQAWATYQADKACPANPPRVDPCTATVEEEIISPGVQSSHAACQASDPSAPTPMPTATKPYVPPTNLAPMPTCKDPIPTAIVPPQTPYPAACNQNQYHYSFPLEDEATPKCIVERVLETSIAMPVKELFAVAPEFCKQFRDITMAKHVTTNEIEVVHSDDEEGVQVNELTGHDPQRTVHEYGDCIIRSDDSSVVAHHTLPLHCIEAKVPGTDITINCILDSGLEIVAMPRCVWEKIGLPLRCDHLMTMTSANMSKDTTVGVLENLKLNFRDGPVMLQVQVIEHANFDMFLGRLFICLMSAVTNDYPDSGQRITL
ncbi:hypothetical protein M404DRAFT_26237 [Pisolithus tinctorius Marx 270]|uniref:Uncharacterized protein n=1 Tax=Pisolithus tinctorius Marx 270 TaxID=870435 RepID=A0A0C3P9B1_PISTI|nr:hypothetical protein M404DRAFT_26237 [Pisolithus tinctorius Marx 270]